MKNVPPFFGADPGRTSFKYAYRLDCSDWTEFFNTQINTPVLLNRTRQEFSSLEPEEQKKAKAVKFFCPATFITNNDGDPRRSNKTNARCRSIALVCLDVDNQDHARQVIENISTVGELLSGLNYAIYHTINSTGDAPRIRVVVEADALPVDRYDEAVSWVAGTLGITQVNSESFIPAQAMYRPTVFADTDVEKYHPVISHRIGAKPLTMAQIEGRPLKEQATRAGRNGTTPHGGNGDEIDELLFLVPRLPMVTLDDARDALEHTDPDLGMMDWIKIGMGMRHQFLEEDEEAFQVFNAWSAKGEKYTGEEDTRKRWGYFSPNTRDRIPVTIRTLFSIAREHGWENEEFQQRYLDEVSAWMENCENMGCLITGGVDRIVGTPLLTPLLQEGLISLLASTVRKKFKRDVGLPAIRRAVKKKQAALKQAEKEQQEQNRKVPSWARGLCFITDSKKILRTTTGEAMDRDSFDSAYARELLPTKEQLIESGEVDNPRSKFTPIIRPQDFVLNDLQIPRVYQETYDPVNPDDIIVKHEGVWYVNTYRRTYPEASKNEEDLKRAGEIVRAHLCLLAQEPELQDLLLWFTAYMVQCPGRKIRWAPLCQGAEGNGKGMWAKINRVVLGPGNVKSVDPDKIFSAYNDWAVGAQLAVLNEIHSKGLSRHLVENKLKEPIADDFVSVNQKYRDHREMRNVTNYFLCTNFPDALAISEGSRRYLVIKSWMQRKDQVLEIQRSGHYDRVDQFIREYPKALRGFFESVQIPASFPVDGPPPVTRYQLEMQKATMPEAELLTHQVLEDGDHPLIQPDLISSTALLSYLNGDISRRTNAKYVANMLSTMGFFPSGRYLMEGIRHTLWLPRDSPLAGLDLGTIARGRVQEMQEQVDLLLD